MKSQNNQNITDDTTGADLLSSMVEQRCWKNKDDNSPMNNLRKALKINSIWGILISLLYLIVFFAYPILVVRIALIILLLFNAWVINASLNILKQTRQDVISEKPLLDVMKFYYNSIHNWMLIQKRMSLFVYPVSVAGGFLLGGVLGSGKSVAEFLEAPNVVYWLIGSIIFLVPVCYIFANAIFKIGFGGHMTRLKQLIDQIEKSD